MRHTRLYAAPTPCPRPASPLKLERVLSEQALLVCPLATLRGPVLLLLLLLLPAPAAGASGHDTSTAAPLPCPCCCW